MREFMQSMGLTASTLADRPQLAHDVLSYHLIPYVKLQTADIKKNYAVAATADKDYTVQIMKGEQGRIVFKDIQGNMANLVQADMDAGFSVVHGIDRVLLSGELGGLGLRW
jgi:uncharacterized surface protein with fasciclin (FAS1) repeats